MKYIDTNVFIYAIENHDMYGKPCKKILNDIQDKNLDSCASMLVLVESINVLAKINKELKKTNQKTLIIGANLNAILSLPITWFELDFLTIRKAAEYSHNIATQDYFHLATMDIQSVHEIISADKELDKVHSIKRIDPLNYKS